MMKKVVLGSIMFLAGLVSTALLLAGAISLEWTIDGEFSAFWNLSQYGLMPVFYAFVCIAALGLCVAMWGLFEKDK